MAVTGFTVSAPAPWDIPAKNLKKPAAAKVAPIIAPIVDDVFFIANIHLLPVFVAQLTMS